MAAQGGAGVVRVEHAGDRDALAGRSERGWGVVSAVLRACLSRLPFPAGRLLTVRLD
jgi:hypothetical protein